MIQSKMDVRRVAIRDLRKLVNRIDKSLPGASINTVEKQLLREAVYLLGHSSQYNIYEIEKVTEDISNLIENKY